MSQTLAPVAPELQPYLQAYAQATGTVPAVLTSQNDKIDGTDVVYPVMGGVWVHIRPGNRGLEYHVLEPTLLPGEEALVTRMKDLVVAAAVNEKTAPSAAELEDAVLRLVDKAVMDKRQAKTPAFAPERVAILRYHVLRDLVRYGPLEPITRDSFVEDIQGVGTEPIHVIHREFGMLPTNVRFATLTQVETYLRTLSERIGRPVSDVRPIVDATLPEGSRINIVYSEDVSRKGPSFSLRRVRKEPMTITQLIATGTISAHLAAYLWLCLENGMSAFVCGGAGCGKSTTLNALLSFIPLRAKIFTAEDTPEVRPPHQVWQRLITRETGPDDTRIRMFDLLKAALRSRPNYIVVGEIRGAEGNVAFQAMQTGHPTIASFHAENKVKMIQRLSAEPINVPITFIDNLNVAVFQELRRVNGHLVRRVVSVDEIEGYSEYEGGVVTRTIFSYDAVQDRHIFRGANNSYLLERKIAVRSGYADPRRIYQDLDQRTRILQGLVERQVFGYQELNQILTDFYTRGTSALPFKVD